MRNQLFTWFGTVLCLAVFVFLSNSQLHAQNYCQPSGDDCGGDQSAVEFIALNGKTLFPGYDCANTYTDMTSDTLFITPDGGLMTGNNTAFVNALLYGFCDWNDDKAFSEDENIAFAGNIVTEYNAQIIPPMGQANGPVRFRVQVADPVLFSAGLGTDGCLLTAFHTVDFILMVVDEVVPTQAYCNARGNSSNDPFDACNDTTRAQDTYITDVEFVGEFDNASNGCSGSTGGYTDFTSFTAVVEEGDDFEIVVDIFTESTATNRLCNVKAWIDWNNDTVFDPATEALITTNIPSEVSFTFTGTVDANLTGGFEGLTRMRVIGYWNYVDGTYLPCGSYTVGEVEDYHVYIGTLPPDCPTNLMPADMTGDICQKDLELSWDAPSGGTTPTGYRLSLGTNNPPNNIYDTIDVGTNTSFTLDTVLLNANSTYYWQVVAYDANGNLSISCDVNEFTTSANGDPFVNVTSGGNDVYQTGACTGVAKELTAQVIGGTPNFTFNWTGADLSKLSSTSTDVTQFTDNMAGNTYKYVVEVSDDNGCMGKDSVFITVEQNADAGTVS
ncbi:MAG: GEVED domain-containing protein, partial [Luteibaculum sp.]